MKIGLLYSLLFISICTKTHAQSRFSIGKLFDNLPINSSFKNIVEYIGSSNCYYLKDSSSNSKLYAEIIQSFCLKKECFPSNVDSVILNIYKGIRSSKIRSSRYYKPIHVTSIQMKFYLNNSFLIDSIYSKMWDSIKVSKSKIGLLQLGIDSLTATYIIEQKINNNGIRNSEFEMTKNGTGQNYICLYYRRDN